MISARAAKSTTPSKQATRRHSHRREPDGSAHRPRRTPSRARGACLAARRPASGAGGRPAGAARLAPCRSSWMATTASFVPTWRRSAALIAVSRQARRQLAAEITAQFAAFRATGLTLDHCNAHKHFHLHPVVGRIDRDDRPALRLARGARAARARTGAAADRAANAVGAVAAHGALCAAAAPAVACRRTARARIASSDCAGPGR